MFGKPLQRDLRFVSMALLGSLTGVIIAFAALWILEDTLRQLDRINQEDLIWDCSTDDVCIPTNMSSLE